MKINIRSLKNSLIVVAIIAIVTVISITAGNIYGRIKESNTDWGISSKLVNTSIPKDAAVLRSSDTHGGFHGDGEYFVVFQFTESQCMEFGKLSENGGWIDLPVLHDLSKFIFGEKKGLEQYEGHGENKIPKITRHGKYYFYDKFIKDNPQYNGISIFDRPASNFIFALLDFDNKKLYVMKYDS